MLVSFLLCFAEGHSQSGADTQKVLNIVQDFFDALERQDTAAFSEIYVEDGRNYAVFELRDTVRVRSHAYSNIRLSPDQIIKERMREETTVVKIEGRIAMVWAPYDLWINGTFSHCGVDVFTLVKDTNGWKIATITYTMEKTGCE